MTEIPTPADEQGWFKTLTNFRAKAREFITLYNNLGSRRGEVVNYPPEFQAQYRELMTRGAKVKKTVEGITSKVDQAWNWLRSTFGFDDNDLKGLGFVQFVPVAIVVAGAAAMGKWVKDAYIHKKTFDAIDSQIAKGVNPTRAYNNATGLQQSFSPPTFQIGKAGPALLIIGLGVGGYFLLKRGK